MDQRYAVYGDLLDREIIDAEMARIVVWIARHARLSRVHRYGRSNERRWILEPRNPQEHTQRDGKLGRRKGAK